MDLLVRPAPKVDESPRGYFWRIAIANGWQSPHLMMNTINRGSNQPLKFKDICCRNLAPLDQEAILAKTPRCDARYILTSHFRVCLQCMAQELYLRESWDYALLPYCSVHHTPLSVTTSLSDLFRRPSCLHMMGKPNNLGCSQNGIQLQRQLATVLGFEQTNLERLVKLSSLDANDIQRLIILLGAYYLYPNCVKPRKLSFVGDLAIARDLIDAAAHILCDWPLSISSLLDRHFRYDIKDRRVGARVGYLYAAIHKEFDHGKFQFLVDAFDEALVSRWPSIIDAKSPSLYRQVSNSPRYVSGTALATKLGISKNTLVSLIERGAIQGRLHQLPSGSQQLTIPVGQENIIRQHLCYLTLSDVATSLGLPKSCVRSLLKSKHISGELPGRRKSWCIRTEAVNKFLEKIKQGAKNSMSSANLKSLNHIARYHLPKSLSVADVIKIMLDQKLPYLLRGEKQSPLLSRITLDIPSVALLFKPDDLVSVPDMARELGIKQEVAYHLVNQNLIASIDLGRAGRFMRRLDVADFCDGFVWARDLSKRVRTSSRRLEAKLRAFAIAPVSGPGVDEGRQLLYRWSDIFEGFKKVLEI